MTNARTAMFLARLSELRAIGTFVEAFCAQAAVARERCLRLNVVLEELFINTVRHGHRGECDAPVWISVRAQPAQVELTYEDTAGPFNPLAYTARPGKIGGLGVLLTRELTAAREYAYLFGRNRIRLALAR
ncbi:MAG: ATP-binding protein [Betaproteobacteria bacterium]|nr:MAG: ATP-binding protein [Betaproteobacteria bacterium]